MDFLTPSVKPSRLIPITHRYVPFRRINKQTLAAMHRCGFIGAPKQVVACLELPERSVAYNTYLNE